MIVYIVWDGYEDIHGVFLRKENAEKCIKDLKEANPRRADWAFDYSTNKVVDAE